MRAVTWNGEVALVMSEEQVEELWSQLGRTVSHGEHSEVEGEIYEALGPVMEG